MGVVVSTPVNWTTAMCDAAGVAPVARVIVPEPGVAVVTAHQTWMDDLDTAPGSATCWMAHDPLMANVDVTSVASLLDVSDTEPVFDTSSITRELPAGLRDAVVYGRVEAETGADSVLSATATPASYC